MTPVRVAVLVSGGGTNLQALFDSFSGAAAHAAPVVIARVISNRPDAGALERARHAAVDTTVLRDATNASELLGALAGSDLVVLAGYLKLVPPEAVARFRWRMINIHPAPLPAFGGPGMYGAKVHQAVLASGATHSGPTVHYVDEHYDRGPVIAHLPVPVRGGDSAETLAARVLAAEHQLLPRVVTLLAQRGEWTKAVRLDNKDLGLENNDGL